jgi:squalene monooxygenase
MREACFDYLSLGGVFSTGPVSLLSGLNPRPLSLVLHFFAVAVFGVGRLLVPFPSPSRIWIGARLISVSMSFFLYFIYLPSLSHSLCVSLLSLIYRMKKQSRILFFSVLKT